MKNKATTQNPAQRYDVRSAKIDGIALLRKESGKIELHVPTRLQQGDLAGWRKRNEKAIADAKRSFNEPRVFDTETAQAPRKRTKLTSLTIEPTATDLEYGITWSREIDVYNEASVGELGQAVNTLTFETSKRDIALSEFADDLSEEQADFIDKLERKFFERNLESSQKASEPKVIKSQRGVTIIESDQREGGNHE